VWWLQVSCLKSHGFLWTLFHAIGHIKLANIVVKEVYIFTNQITGKRFNVLPFSILLYLYCVLSSLFSFMLLREEEKFVSSTPNTVLNVYIYMCTWYNTLTMQWVTKDISRQCRLIILENQNFIVSLYIRECSYILTARWSHRDLFVFHFHRSSKRATK
jgi:hypothetical protein